MDEYRPSGLGCGWWMVAGGLIVLLIMASAPDSKNTTPGSISNSRTGTLSGNQVEVMSRNQLNLWSDVQNCYGDYSCMTIISTTTSTATSTTVDNTRNTTTVTGDRNVVIGSDGAKLCEDPQTHIYTTTACQ